MFNLREVVIVCTSVVYVTSERLCVLCGTSKAVLASVRPGKVGASLRSESGRRLYYKNIQISDQGTFVQGRDIKDIYYFIKLESLIKFSMGSYRPLISTERSLRKLMRKIASETIHWQKECPPYFFLNQEIQMKISIFLLFSL